AQFIFLRICVVFFSAMLMLPVYAKGPADNKQCFYVRKFSEKYQRHYFVRHCRKPKGFDEQVSTFLTSLTPDQHSALQRRLEHEKKIEKTRYGISFFEPTYILPFYYTGRPDFQVYSGTTPDNQKVMNAEFKAQVSLMVPLWVDMFHSHWSLTAAYTQLSYWQVYAKSQYFRETNYEPTLFASINFLPNWQLLVGMVHQSNGRGGSLERSWNRAYIDIEFSGTHWLVSIKPWVLIFKSESSDLHNPDIRRYLGNARVVVAYQFHHQELSLMVRNAIDSGFSRGAIQLGYQFPIYGKVNGFIQFFSGYGQSLIEYDHYTNSVGAGVILSNWI
ncbi:MAG: phospholipase A, partial [Coxiellaceae bacterium]|nr:phospholipase A [Coxiellaceae bacterium]